MSLEALDGLDRRQRAVTDVDDGDIGPVLPACLSSMIPIETPVERSNAVMVERNSESPG